MMTSPKLTPKQANEQLISNGGASYNHGGFTYFNNAMLGAPIEVAAAEGEGADLSNPDLVLLFPNGEPGDPITDENYWIEA
jgi:hypothetical protein